MNNKLRLIFQIILFLPWSIYFNFHYLPFKQALKLPIVLYKPKLICCKGKIVINGPISFAMIKLGFYKVSLYPNTGIRWENKGIVIFNGWAIIGHDSSISIGKTGNINIGAGFRATCSFKLACYNKINFGENVLVGWDCTFTDTDFHTLHSETGKTKGYGEIIIGKNNWIAMQTLCLKGSKTANYSVIGARSLLNTDLSKQGENVLISGNPARIVKTGLFHDYTDDIIVYDAIQ